MTCDHPESSHVIDEREGTIICTACSFVISDGVSVNIPTQTNETFDTRAISNFNYIDRISFNNNMDISIVQRAYNIERLIRAIIPKRSSLHIAIFSIYTAAMQVKNPYTVEEISQMVKMTTSSILKIISSIAKLSDYADVEYFPSPLYYLNRMCANLLSQSERSKIFNYYIGRLPSRFSARSPRLVLAAIICHYFQSRNVIFLSDNVTVIQAVCSHLNVSRRHVRLILDDLNNIM